MLFIKQPQIIEAWEDGDKFGVTQIQDVGPTLKLCHDLREHGETKGWTVLRTMKMVAQFPEIVELDLRKNRPEVFRDQKELDKWLATDGKVWKVAPDAPPIKGDGLQVNVR